LGYGGYSTIWLAKDEKPSGYIAVNVSFADNNNSHYNILRQLGSPDLKDGNPGREIIPRY